MLSFEKSFEKYPKYTGYTFNFKSFALDKYIFIPLTNK